MKKTFSFLVIFLVSLFGIFGNYNFKNYNSEINTNQQVLIDEENTNDVDSTVKENGPKIISFTVNESKTTTNSVSVNWIITDINQKVTKIEIYDKDNDLKLAEYDKTNLIMSDAKINNLNSNTNYNLELRVSWKDDSTIVIPNETKQYASTITKAVEPNSVEFSLFKINKSNVILSINYEDLDNVVDKITIHDKNGNMEDVVLSPNDLEDGKYKLSGINSGTYNLELILHWTSLSEENTIKSTQSLQFIFKKGMSVALISTISIIIFLLILIFLILYVLKSKNNKQKRDNNSNKIK